jgi:hypothetical protein
MTPNQPDAVFDLLIEADPVPDPHSIREETEAQVVSLHPVRTGSEPMQTIHPEPGHPDSGHPDLDTISPSPERGRRSWMLAAAAAVIVVLGVGALFISRGDETEDPVQNPVTTPAPPVTTVAPATTDAPDGAALGPEDEAAAQAATLEFYRAVADGDVETLEAMMTPSGADTDESNRRMFAMNAYNDSNGNGLVFTGECEVLASLSRFIDVGCEATMTDPVWAALDVSELIVPARYMPDGTVEWLAFKTVSGADFTQANRAYSTYLQEFHPDEYAAVCDPLAYDARTTHGNQGLTLTVECAELWVPLGHDVAAWVVETGFGSD